MSLTEHYGPWAVISGASEGTGRAFARKIAREGINCVLIARRERPLAELADELRGEYGVECVTAAIDLSAPDASDRVKAAAGDREVGLYVSNAGADPEGARFLDIEVDRWVDQVNRGIVNLMRCCHHFGGQMRGRKRGGLLLVGSGACYGGSSFMATYAGLKAFGLNFAEGLWAELRPHGVDVLYAALGTTDTPAFRALAASKGLPLPPGLADAQEVAEVVLSRLADGPLMNWGLEDEDAGHLPMSASARRTRVLAIGEATKRIFGE
ncbi:SDR family NAD(P)-dependent oxidoreductase [Sphingomonas cavernae]|uniref:SDR family NAD(P)-dependent oxidoreductase n=1 Tax=Sphingomonas cavernae TaxID=2320861 RepID=A0A418WME8_9SPHN|nr:SDR family NAD(P)-dependent oxidoreductase [Sphingomonas cavernae]RJF91167.1 SDR family NAD(P)-dependent oxidoreductase [Sphingomonas cavernae]